MIRSLSRVSRIEEDRKRQRDGYLLLIIAAVGVIYLLWAVSWLFAPERSEQEIPSPPADELTRLDADLDLAERLLAKNRPSEASRYLNNVRDGLQHMPSEGLRPAQALRLSRIEERLSQLHRQLDELNKLDEPRKGTALAAPGGIQ